MFYTSMQISLDVIKNSINFKGQNKSNWTRNFLERSPGFDMVSFCSNKTPALSYQQEIEEKIATPVLGFDPMQPDDGYVNYYPEARTPKKIYQISEIGKLEPVFHQQDKIYFPEFAFEDFCFDGKVRIELPITPKISIKKDENASLSVYNKKELGKYLPTDLALNYGTNINWSNQKIARDILQNFYDGHGHTLDGTKFFIQMRGSDKASIKIWGLSEYNHENLKYLGANTKFNDLYNAGGFGEGAKIAVTSMISRGICDKVNFASADWRMSFIGEDGILKRKLDRAQNPIQGNVLEIENVSINFVQSFLEAINYFEHSQNPDFSEFDYENEDFAFQYLGNKHGNIYLTQRFEFASPDSFAKPVEALKLVFRKKPDPEKYKELFLHDPPKDRDRTYLNRADLTNFVHYFAKETMSEEDIIKSILLTRPYWGTPGFSSKYSTMNAFVSGLISAARDLKIGIDGKSERLCSKTDDNLDLNIIKMLEKEGFTVLPSCFQEIGVPTTNDTLVLLSRHVPLEPTKAEKQKIIILDEAMKVLYQEMQHAFCNKVSTISINFRKDTLDGGHALSELFHNYFSDEEYEELFHNSPFSWLPQKERAQLLETLKGRIKATLNGEINPNNWPKEKYFTLLKNALPLFDYQTQLQIINLLNLKIITLEDIKAPKHVFDSRNEFNTNTVGEAIIKRAGRNMQYFGHWIDREYLKTIDFPTALSVWIHEICHKIGDDGSAKFTYALTDIMQVLFSVLINQNNQDTIKILNDIYNSIKEDNSP